MASIRPALPLDNQEIANIVMHYKKEEVDDLGYIMDEALDMFTREYRHIFGVRFVGSSLPKDSKSFYMFDEGSLFSIDVLSKVDIEKANEELGPFLESIGVSHRIELRRYV